MDVMVRKEIFAKVDSIFDSQIQELHQENKQLFLNSRFEQFRSDEITRQNDNLSCEIELLQKLFGEQNEINTTEREMLLTRHQASDTRFNNEIQSLRLKLKTIEKQLEEALQNETSMKKTIHLQELTIKSDVRFKKVDILEKENGELVYKLHQSEEKASEKEYKLREHKLHCNKTIKQLKTDITRLEIEIEESKKKHSEKEKFWREEQDLMERKQKQHWIALEEEKLNSKLQVASVQKVKDVELSKMKNAYVKYRTRCRESEKKVEQLQKDVKTHSKDVEKYEQVLKQLKSDLLESDKCLIEKTKKIETLLQSEKSIRKKANKYKDECKTNQKQIRKISKEKDEIKTQLQSKIEKIGELKDQIEQISENGKVTFFREQCNDGLDEKIRDQDIAIKKQEMEIERLKHKLYQTKTNQTKQQESCYINNNDGSLEIQHDHVVNKYKKETTAVSNEKGKMNS